jgi:thioredoxin 2
VPASAAGIPVCGSCGTKLPWIVDAGDGDFDEATAGSGAVVVDLWAPWCGPCKLIEPMLERLAGDEAGHLKVVRVNVDRSPQVSQRFAVQSIPMLLLMRDGALVETKIGAPSEAVLREWVQPLLADR